MLAPPQNSEELRKFLVILEGVVLSAKTVHPNEKIDRQMEFRRGPGSGGLSDPKKPKCVR